jgi:hypothetical protein
MSMFEDENGLGNALDALGRWEGRTAQLEEAVMAFRASLEETPPASGTHLTGQGRRTISAMHCSRSVIARSEHSGASRRMPRRKALKIAQDDIPETELDSKPEPKPDNANQPLPWTKA